MHIKKAVFPVAGLGENFLPATKASPKEMMPIVDMPLIQYAVNEAISAGISELIFVTNSSKRAIEDHFDTDLALEAHLLESGKFELLDIVRNILPAGVTCAYIRQKSPQGLGDAILCAKQFIGNEPFAVLLADDLIKTDGKSCLRQMMDVFKENQSSIIAVQKVSHKDTSKYGIVDVLQKENKLSNICNLIEKPSTANAPSDLAVVGRYIFTPKIFACLEQTSKGLIDAITKLLLEESVFSLQFKGSRFDCGTKLGYIQATIAFALKHPEVAHDFKKILQNYIES